jgi:hypothetical protein
MRWRWESVSVTGRTSSFNSASLPSSNLIMKTMTYFALMTGALCVGSIVSAAPLTFNQVAEPPTNAGLNAIMTDGTNFVAVGTDSVTVHSLERAGALDWETTQLPVEGLTLLAVTRGPGGFAAGGVTNLVFSLGDDDAWISKGRVHEETTTAIRGIASLPEGRHVAVLASPVIRYAESDLASWSPATISNFNPADNYRAVAPLGDDGFVAVGTGGTVRISSDNGETWDRLFSPTSGDLTLHGVTIGNDRIVAVGTNGVVRVSPDAGATWETRNSATNAIGEAVTLNAVTFTGREGEEFLAVGEGGVILTSTDGLDWTEVESPTTEHFRGVAYAASGPLAGVAVIVGDNGTILVGGELPTIASIAIDPHEGPYCPGSTVTFSVDADGPNLAYQWYRRVNETTTAIEGAIGGDFTIEALSEDHSAHYWAEVTSVVGDSVLSEEILLTVDAPPEITQQPSSLIVCPGDIPAFMVEATGSSLNFQWYQDEDEIPGAVEPSFTPSIETLSEPGIYTYHVVVTDACDASVTSDAITLTVNPPTEITQQPVSVTVCLGQTASFTVAAAGVDLSFQWYQDEDEIPGADGPNFTPSNVTLSEPGTYTYHVVVTDACDASVTSDEVTLTVNPLTEITQQPVSVTVCLGQTASFTVAATGVNLNYQWYQIVEPDADSIPVASGIEFNPQEDVGEYTYRVEVSGDCGDAVWSDEVMLIVNEPVAITQQPFSQTVCQGETAELSVMAVGSDLTYQWFTHDNETGNDTEIVGATNASFTPPLPSLADPGDFGYRVVVTGSCGNELFEVPSEVATFTVPSGPCLTIELVDGLLEIRWVGEHQLEETSTLSPALWTAVEATLVDGTYVYETDVDGPPRYFRLQAAPVDPANGED